MSGVALDATPRLSSGHAIARSALDATARFNARPASVPSPRAQRTSDVIHS
jgi:hypothetical protein